MPTLLVKETLKCYYSFCVCLLKAVLHLFAGEECFLIIHSEHRHVKRNENPHQYLYSPYLQCFLNHRAWQLMMLHTYRSCVKPKCTDYWMHWLDFKEARVVLGCQSLNFYFLLRLLKEPWGEFNNIHLDGVLSPPLLWNPNKAAA